MNRYPLMFDDYANPAERCAPQGRSRRIVVGVVDTASSRSALRWAWHVASSTNAGLEIVTVFPRSPAGEMEHYARHEARALRMQGNVVCDELGLSRLEVPVWCDAVAGDPVDVLCRLADGADLLVVGLTDPDVDELRSSSVGEWCIVLSTCPVVMVAEDGTALFSSDERSHSSTSAMS